MFNKRYQNLESANNKLTELNARIENKDIS